MCPCRCACIWNTPAAHGERGVHGANVTYGSGSLALAALPCSPRIHRMKTLPITSRPFVPTRPAGSGRRSKRNNLVHTGPMFVGSCRPQIWGSGGQRQLPADFRRTCTGVAEINKFPNGTQTLAAPRFGGQRASDNYRQISAAHVLVSRKSISSRTERRHSPPPDLGVRGPAASARDVILFSSPERRDNRRP